ncbi:MAG: aliphatic sulfonate ABC transporter substrate-binding protein [Thermomicrobiales bacterium]|nr:aliphatic sulfonate ABC transporter substrate-binding protein [Thermomicrobiales bacterium]
MSFDSRFSRRTLLGGAAGAGLAAGLTAIPGGVHAQDSDVPDKIRLDYAYWNPSSLVIRDQGWLEEEFSAEGAEIEWVWSAGSNKANEWLRSDVVDIGSTAGSAALLARTNGSNIHTIYLFSQPEWAALVAKEGSEITKIEDLAGKKVAATKGTDPYFFLLQSLASVGLSGSDVEVVNLQHADGRVALINGDVDAWSGLDPYMAQTELEEGSVLFYRNIDFNTWGYLNIRENFLNDHPAVVSRILQQYERARLWIQENPAEASAILAKEAELTEEVSNVVLHDRTNLDIDPIPGDVQRAVLEVVIPIFEAEDQLQPGSDVQEALDTLYATDLISEIYTPAS